MNILVAGDADSVGTKKVRLGVTKALDSLLTASTDVTLCVGACEAFDVVAGLYGRHRGMSVLGMNGPDVENSLARHCDKAVLFNSGTDETLQRLWAACVSHGLETRVIGKEIDDESESDVRGQERLGLGENDDGYRRHRMGEEATGQPRGEGRDEERDRAGGNRDSFVGRGVPDTRHGDKDDRITWPVRYVSHGKRCSMTLNDQGANPTSAAEVVAYIKRRWPHWADIEVVV